MIETGIKCEVCVVIPCYKAAGTVSKVVQTLPDFVRHVIVVDDACPEGSAKVAEALNDNRVHCIYLDKNQGVGGAVVAGYRHALKIGSEIVVKMDADGQMDPAYLEQLIDPVRSGEADYAKGNRFRDFRKLLVMPKARFMGNSLLSFLVKFSSGYWNIIDPTNGYTAINSATLESLSLEKLSKRYFFETSMLMALRLNEAVVKDVSIPARYGNEISSLNIWKALVQFPPRLCAGLLKRLFVQYFIHDFNMVSVYLLAGVPLLTFGVIYGLYRWYASYLAGILTPPGTIMLAALPIILGFQMLLQAINIDMNTIPRKK